MSRYVINGKLVLGSQEAMTLPRLAADPSPIVADLYYNTTSNTIRYYDGTAWNGIATGVVSLTGQVLLEDNIVVGGASNISSSVDTSALGEVSVSTATGVNIKPSVITDNKIASNAAITRSKLASGTNNTLVINDASGKMIDLNAITGDKALVSSVDGLPIASSVTSAELENVSGVTSPIQTQLDDITTDLSSNYIPLLQKGASGGVATLDGGGKIPVAQLPSSVMTYEGTWDASTNTPTLVDGTGDAGMVYLATVAGTVDFGSGDVIFAQGDWAVYNGLIWEKSGNSNAVVSVNTKTGVVVLTTTDIAEGTSLYFTDERAQDAVGSMLTDGAKISFVYDDASATITATIVAKSLDNGDISDTAAISLSKLAALTASRALVSDGAGVITPSAVTTTELEYLSGTTSSVQTQIDTKADRKLSNLTRTATSLAASVAVPTTISAEIASNVSVSKSKHIQYEMVHPSTSEVRSGNIIIAAGNVAAGNISIIDNFTSTAASMDTVSFSATLNTVTGDYDVLFVNPEAVIFSFKFLQITILV